MDEVYSQTAPAGNGATAAEDSTWPEINIRAARDADPAIPDALYDAKCVAAEIKAMPFAKGERRLVLHFEVWSGPHDGKCLRFIIPLPRDGRAAPSSKLVRSWTVAAGHASARRDRLSTTVFCHKLFRIRTRTVTVNARRQALAPANRYSVVDQLVERIA